MRFPRPTLSGVIAVLALSVAVSGTAYAAAALPKNSVGAAQIKTNAVRSDEIKKDAVRSSDIKNGVVGLNDLDDPVVSALDRAPTAYQVSTGSIQFVGASFASFATMDVDEAGDYLVTANLRVFPKQDNPGDGLSCNIVGGIGIISVTNQGVDTTAGVGQVTMHGVLPNISAGTTLDLQCRAQTNEITLSYDWTAVQVNLK